MNDPHNLQRFLDAQSPVYEKIREELRQGRKTSHWMWFIFPQIKGLGSSPTAQHFAIASLTQAQAYSAHDLLGPRLRECTYLVNSVEARTAQQIFGEIDSMKFRSSMTLFAHATPDNSIFQSALAKYFAGKPDPQTLSRIQSR